MASDGQTSGRPDPTPGEARGARPVDPLRDVIVPALLALAIMLIVWWYWRVAVVDVGDRAQESPAEVSEER